MFSKKLILREFKAYLLKNLSMVLLLCLIILPICAIYYNSSLEAARRDQLASLNMGVGMLNSQIAMLEGQLVELCSTNEARLFTAKTSLAAQDFITVRNISASVRTLLSACELTNDIIVSFPASNTVIATEGAFTTLAVNSGAKLFGDYYSFSNASFADYVTDTAQLSSDLMFLPGMTMNIPRAGGERHIAFCYCVKIGMGSNYMKSYAFVMIDAAKLRGLFSNLGGELALYDFRDSPVATLFTDKSVHELETSEAEMVESERYSRLRARLWINPEEYGDVVESALYTILLYSIAAVLLSVVLAVVSAYQLTRPVSRLLAKFSELGLEGGGAGSAFGYFTSSVDELYARHQESSNELSQYKRLLRSNMLDRYLCSPFDPSPDGEAPELDSLPQSYVVGYGILHTENDANQESQLLTLMVGQKLSSELNAVCHELLNTTFALIIPAQSESDAQLGRIQSLVSSLDNVINVPFSLSISGVHLGLRELNRAYEDARSVMARAKYAPGFHREDGLPPGANTTAKPLDNPLYAAAVDGNAALAREILNGILFGDYTSADLEQRYYYARMLINMAQRALMGDNAAEPPKYASHISPSALYDQLASPLDELCGAVSASKAENIALQNKLIRFIDERFTRDDISVQLLASEFGLSEKAFNAALKSATGMNANAYLQQLRLDKACSLLRNTDEKINYICKACGYNTLNAFYKAFRRVYGKSPSEYREAYMDKS